MLVQNLSVPLDRRVWQECIALRHAGMQVTVICPRGNDRDDTGFELRDGIEIHRYEVGATGSGAAGYLREYMTAYLRIRRLSRRLARTRRFDVVHAANPPDFLLLAARHLRRTGARFVFDHHDLAPELYLSRFGGRRDLFHRILLVIERLAFRQADVVIATNDSYRRIAVERGRKRPEDVFVVRNGPDPEHLRPQPPDPELRRGKHHLLAYVGMMGPQDGVDHALRALHALRARRDDWHAIFAGDGDVRPAMERFASELGLADVVEFRGVVRQDEVVRILSSSDVCIAPEPSNPLNDVSTMIKVAEYMSIGRPVAAYDLRETRATAGDAAAYAAPNDPEALAEVIDGLLADDELRQALGAAGRERVLDTLQWNRSVPALLAAYERVLELPRAPQARATAVAAKT